MKEFKHIWAHDPIDFWEGATIANEEETQRVLSQMPEAPRYHCVYKLFMLWDVTTVPIYCCIAENNGTCYVFCDKDPYQAFDELARKEK